MKFTSLVWSVCFCSTILSRLVLSAAGSRFADYNTAKDDFEARGLIQKYDLNGAKKWFRDKGYGKDFENYFEAKEFLKKKGSLSRTVDDASASKHHDVMACLYLSDLVYGIANLRKDTMKYAYKEKELKQEVLIGKSFVSEEDDIAMAELLTGNLKVSADPDVMTHHVSMDHFEDVLRSKEAYENSHKTFSNLLTVEGMEAFAARNFYIYKFDAKYNTENLVYTIAGKERDNGETDLYLAFRGTVTFHDFWADIQAPQEVIELRHDKQSGKSYMVEQQTFQKIEIEKALYDEFKKITDEGPPIKIHQGFLGYLFANRGTESELDHNEDNDSMYTNIQLNIKRLVKQKGTINNQLYVTGHSLGGSLATIAAFFLASDKTINNNSVDWKGVKCISWASPQVGNVSFRKAFEVLMAKEQYQSETAKPSQEGRLFSNIRITNNRDPVPLVIFPSAYRHVGGVHVHLNRPSILSFWRPRKPSIEVQGSEPQIRLRDIFKNLRKPWRIIPEASMMRGFFENSRHLFGLVMTVIPSLMIVPFVFLKGLLSQIPQIEGFSALFSSITQSKLYTAFVGLLPKALTGAIATFSKNSLFRVGLIGIPVVLFLQKTAEENSGLPLRIVMAASSLVPLTYLFTHHEHSAISLLLVAQVAAIAFRAPFDLLTIKMHLLPDYYDHLSPHYSMLSSSAAIFEQAGI